MNLKQHVSRNWHLAYPVMLSQLGHVMVGVADSVMVGRIGAEPLAAASLANVVFHVLMTFGIGISYSITPIVAAADGEKNHNMISDTLKHGLMICMLSSLILLVVQLLSGFALPHINQPPDVVALAIPYLYIIAFSIVPIMLFQTYRQFAEGLSLTRMAMVITVGGNLLNIILNYFLIYGKAGFPALGLNGAGYATLISRVVIGVGMMAYIFYASRFALYRSAFAFGQYSKKMIRRLLNIGIPAGIQFIFEVSAFGFSAIMMGWIGTNALAAHQIAINMATISYMTTSGLAAAATIRVGNQLGKKDIPNMRKAGMSLIGMAMVIMAVWAMIFIFGRYYFPTLYINDQEVIAVAASLLIIAGFFQLSDGLQVVCIGALRGLEDMKVPTLFIFIAYWIIALPLGYCFTFIFNWGAVGIWWGLLIGLTITGIMMYMRFRKLSKKLLLEVKAD
jgi:multidrug resistance protein, MATE family